MKIFLRLPLSSCVVSKSSYIGWRVCRSRCDMMTTVTNSPVMTEADPYSPIPFITEHVLIVLLPPFWLYTSSQHTYTVVYKELELCCKQSWLFLMNHWITAPCVTLCKALPAKIPFLWVNSANSALKISSIVNDQHIWESKVIGILPATWHRHHWPPGIVDPIMHKKSQCIRV